MLTKVVYAEQIPRKLSRDNKILWYASYVREPRSIERSRQHSYRLQERSAIKETVSRHTTGKPVSGKFVRVTAFAVELSKPSLIVDLSKLRTVIYAEHSCSGNLIFVLHHLLEWM